MIATATCPRCGRINELTACQNCGSTDFRRGPLSDGSVGMICQACNLGFSLTPCQGGCGTLISATMFGTPVSRAAGEMQRNLNAAQGGQCFIATELYGGDSTEVAVLRRLRDQVLLENHLGQRFVATYYRVGPAVILVMRRSLLVRLGLHALVAAAVFVLRRASACWGQLSGRRVLKP